ncbi:352_t:CDS:10 [Ambispora leptoticha]|uniref:DASH complex subunit SPC19 n=1 Tax=Ambispora leptoticha TaxID=144679 RepID=A0A9N8WCZ2_9GLOM|nr:352_t:CDS:10 [Ambispora leptoticha]
MTQKRFNNLAVTSSSITLPPVYIQNLERCVEKLQNSSLLLQASIKRLETSTHDFSRLNKVLGYKRRTSSIKMILLSIRTIQKYELVTESDVNDAQKNLAKELTPKIQSLTEQAERELTILEQREHELQEEIDKQEIELDSLQLANTLNKTNQIKKDTDQSNSNNNSAKLSLSRQKKQQQNLKLLKAQRIDLSKKLEYLTEQIQKTESELRDYKRRNCGEQKLPSPLITQQVFDTRSSTNNIILSEVEALHNQIEEIDTQINERQQLLSQHKETRNSLDSLKKNEQQQDDDIWASYEKQLNFFKDAQKRSKIIFTGHHDDICEFEAIYSSYLENIDVDLSEMTKSIPKLEEKRDLGIEYMKGIADFLYPNNLGSTIGRVLETLLGERYKEIYLPKLGQEFPKAQERRHRLHTAISFLNNLSITETEFEEDAKGEGQLLLKIKLEEDS